jgi:NAD(P)-dependent dehydrogenase (short-subunit alcohol dehydrogenase family)
MGTMVITGGASGMGAATAARLREVGHRVVVVDMAEHADVVADLSSIDGRRKAIDEVASMVDGCIDGLATYAGVAGRSWRPGRVVVSTNYFGTVELLQAWRPLLAAATAPAAVAISSNSTTTTTNVSDDIVTACLDGDEERACALADGGDSWVAYPSSKTAVARWVRRHAVTPEWIGAGITLNAIAPGVIETAMSIEGRTDPAVSGLLDRFPLPAKRSGRPEEVAALCSYLLGPDARFFCGSVIFIDGGTDAFLRADDWPSKLTDESAW